MIKAEVMHEKIIEYMIKKGYYNTNNPEEQIMVDLKATDTVLSIKQ